MLLKIFFFIIVLRIAIFFSECCEKNINLKLTKTFGMDSSLYF